MHPVRKRRLIFVGLILGAVAMATGAVVYGLQKNMNYLFTPSQVLAGRAADYHTFRLGGMVENGSHRARSAFAESGLHRHRR